MLFLFFAILRKATSMHNIRRFLSQLVMTELKKLTEMPGCYFYGVGFFGDGVYKIPLRFHVEISQLLFRCRIASPKNKIGCVIRDLNTY